jgi:hypothetical protein
MFMLKIIGTVFCAIGIAIMWFQYRATAAAEITDGKVIELIPVRGSKGGTNYKIRAEFLDKDKKRHEYLSSWSASAVPYGVGDTVRIAFDRDNPDSNRMFSFGVLYGTGWVILGIGLLLFWIAFGFGYGNAYMKATHPNTF